MAGSGCNAYQIRKIYAIGGALGMVKRNEEDDLLHELVEGMTGKKSIKALTYGEACKVIGELEGRQGTPPPRKSGKPLRKTAPGHTSEGQRRKVWALMYRLQDASPSKAPLGDRLCAIIKKELGIPSDVALCEKSVSADHHFYTLVERRTSFAGRLTIQYRLYCSDNKSTLGRRVPLASLPQYERLEDEYTFAVPIDGVGMVFLRMPTTNCVDGSADGVSIYEPAMGLIHRINENELQFSREFELGRMRVVASADILRTHNGKKLLTDDVFVGLDGNEQSVGITPFAPALRNESYEARRQTYLKAIENLLGIKRGILSDAEAVSKTATEINSSAGDYSLSIMDFQHLYYDALQAALRLGDQIGQAYRLCDASAWDADELAVTWGNGVLYDADQEWTERKELVQMGLLKPELALAWKFDLPAETEADLAEIRKNYMPELKDLEG